MKLVALSLAFCAAAFCQNAPQTSTQTAPPPSLLDKLIPKPIEPLDLAKNRLDSMKLTMPLPLRIELASSSQPKSCAIPLLNAMPAKAHVEYRIQVVGPAVREQLTPSAPPLQIGIPACPPASK